MILIVRERKRGLSKRIETNAPAGQPLIRLIIPFSAKINMNIQKEENFEGIEFNGIQDIKDIKSKSFYNCTFINCDFTESDFHFHFYPIVYLKIQISV